MAGCSGCSGDVCLCVVEAGPGISVSGNGNPSSPYIVGLASAGTKSEAQSVYDEMVGSYPLAALATARMIYAEFTP